MELVIGRELEIYGSHGLAAADYRPLLELVIAGKIPARDGVQNAAAGQCPNKPARR